ncbi:MAG: dipeptidase [Solobacterium sp.]|nr:dipeptidase [Solobacterium sp.]MBQ6505789.1 dipeptidase [Clostridia bacterium]
MKYIDMHCDTVMLLYRKAADNRNMYEQNDLMIDFRRMQAGDALAQWFAVFLPPEKGIAARNIYPVGDDEKYIAATRKIIMDNVAAHDDVIRMACTAEDIEHNLADGRMSAVLTMEDGRAVLGKLENIRRFYDMGFRACSLTWNAHNCFGAPNSSDPEIMNEGLTEFGKDGVRYMQELGMLVDVSHLSDGGFRDVADICTKPFVATHSNARALCPHQRNLTDEQIRILADAGGVTGMNFYPSFLNADMSAGYADAAVIAKHARHIVNTGGIAVCGIGTDFDGFEGKNEIMSSDRMPLLIDALKAEHFTEDEIEKIFWKNVLRVMRDAIK